MSDEKCLIEPQRDCLGIKEARRVEEALNKFKTDNSDSHARIFARLEVLERDYAVQSERYKNILEKIEQLTIKVSTLEALPGKRYEGIIDKVVSTLIGGVIGFLLFKLGLGG